MGKARTRANPDAIKKSPFDTEGLRVNLAAFFETVVHDGILNADIKIGNYKCGVYLFRDYDNEPIYVGQTREGVRVRIQRHLTNQRTDAVAMSVLDPFEVLDIQVWVLPQYQNVDMKSKAVKTEVLEALNALERKVYEVAIAESHFKAILNEKNPPVTQTQIDLPVTYTGRIVAHDVYELRKHPDTRLARRALILSRLSQVIAERKVQGGLRRVLLTQAERIRSLAKRRFEGLGGETTVEAEDNTAEENDPE